MSLDQLFHCLNDNDMVFTITEFSHRQQKHIFRLQSKFLPFLLDCLCISHTESLQIDSDSWQIIGFSSMKFLFCSGIVLMIDRYQHIRPSAQHLLHRIVHQPVHNRCPLIEMKPMCRIDHFCSGPVPGDPCHHTTNRAVTVAKCIPILLHQTFYLPQCPHVLPHVFDIPCEINLVAAHMHILQFLFQFCDTLIRAGISFDKIAGHIYLIPQFLQQCNVWHIKLINHGGDGRQHQDSFHVFLSPNTQLN